MVGHTPICDLNWHAGSMPCQILPYCVTNNVPVMQVQLKFSHVGVVALVSIRYFSHAMHYDEDTVEAKYFLVKDDVVELSIPIVFDKRHDYAFIRILCEGVQVFAQLLEKRLLKLNECGSHILIHGTGMALMDISPSLSSLGNSLWLRNPRVFSRKEKTGYSLCTEQGRGFLLKNRLAKAWESCQVKNGLVNVNNDIVDLEAVQILSTHGLVNRYSFVRG